MLILQSIVLGIIQGLTEFIPISSSAHLIIVPWLFKWNDPALNSLSFDVSLHLGTLVAVLTFFAADWVRLCRAGVASLIERKIGNDHDRQLAWLLLIGCIPGGIVGVLSESKIEKLFHEPNVPLHAHAIIAMAVIIVLFGLVLFITERMTRHLRAINTLTLKDALIIGVAQALAIFPGVSRSGATMTAGLAIGLTREAAAKFSFLLSAPIIAGAGLKSSLEIYKGFKTGAITHADMALFPIGFFFAAVTGFFCIKYLMRFLQKHSMDAFVYYRWALALLMILVVLVRG